jgi:hypothetical protein
MLSLSLSLALGACGGGADAGGRSGTVVYGDPDATTTTASTARAPAAAAGDAGPQRGTTVANRTERLDASGVFLVLVASGATTFRTTDRVTFELAFENRSGRTFVHDSNQDLRFALYRKLGGARTEVAWSNRECRASLGELDEDKPVTGILELGPGESGSFVDDYPTKATSEQGFGPDPDQCRVTPGDYLLVGFLDWCPDETLKRSDYNGAPYCDREKVQQLRSSPLALTFV